jgi:hypothetical protein
MPSTTKSSLFQTARNHAAWRSIPRVASTFPRRQPATWSASSRTPTPSAPRLHTAARLPSTRAAKRRASRSTRPTIAFTSPRETGSPPSNPTGPAGATRCRNWSSAITSPVVLSPLPSKGRRRRRSRSSPPNRNRPAPKSPMPWKRFRRLARATSRSRKALGQAAAVSPSSALWPAKTSDFFSPTAGGSAAGSSKTTKRRSSRALPLTATSAKASSAKRVPLRPIPMTRRRTSPAATSLSRTRKPTR